MIHISEGVLPPAFLAGTAVVAALGVAVGIRSLRERDIPKVALFTAAFFVASLVHVPVGFSSAHLVLNGLLGIVLGWASFPAIFVGLFLQAVLFQFGGLTTLGCNTLNMGLPAVLSGMAFRMVGPRLSPGGRVAVAALLGGSSVLLAGVMVAGSLATAGDSFGGAAALLLLAHLPVAAVEAVVTAGVVGFLQRVRPESLDGALSKAAALLMVAVVACALPYPAWAHRVNVFAWYTGKEIQGEAYFSGGRRPQKAEVQLIGAKGEVVTSTVTDDKGRFRFPEPPPGRYQVRLNAGLGHMAEATVDVPGEKAPSPTGRRPVVGSVAPTPASGQKVGRAGQDGLEAGRCITQEQLDAALDLRLKPVENELRRLAEAQSSITFHDVVAGLGYIVGLMGLALYLKRGQDREL